MIALPLTCECGGRKHSKKSHCFTCAKKIEIAARQEAKIISRTANCQNCGKEFYQTRKGQKICSKDCLVQPVAVNCFVCGKEKMLPKILVRDRNCCSLECQRKWALDERHSGKINVDWSKRSQRAKAKHKRKRSMERLKKSEHYEWWQLARKSLKKKKETTVWERKCTSAKALLSRRLECTTIRKKESKKVKDWEECIKINLCCLKSKTKRIADAKASNGWSTKCAAAAHSLVVRRKIRQARKNTLNHIKD